MLSSLDAADLSAVAPGGTNLSVDEYIVSRAAASLQAGCDGVIVSGSAIACCRRQFDRSVVIVSPGIRPAGSSADDQKRHTTPAEAIRLGSDYLVVGRPIMSDPDPRRAAARVINEESIRRSAFEPSDLRRTQSGQFHRCNPITKQATALPTAFLC